ncbi:TolB family protein [candidate division KSB1 bacterium]
MVKSNTKMFYHYVCILCIALLISVYSCKKSPTEHANSRPVVSEITADPSYIKYVYSDTAAYSLITVSAHDPDGDALTYDFSAINGEIHDAVGNKAKYYPVEFTGMTNVACRVSDRELYKDCEVDIFVNYQANSAPEIKSYNRYPQHSFVDEFWTVNPVMLEVVVKNINHDGLTYTFETEQGILSDQDSNMVKYTPPVGEGEYYINCIVSDRFDIDSCLITVREIEMSYDLQNYTRIAFSSDRTGDFEIYTIRPDGTDLKRLTNSPGNDLWPDWSPDGSQIVFTSTRSGSSDIWVMDSDGSNQTQLTYVIQPNNLIDSEYYPRWSPDGSKIMFTYDRFTKIELFIINPDGSDVKGVKFLSSYYTEDYGD